MAKQRHDGRYTASVSIRSGTHDRVMRLIPVFDTAQAALCHAQSEGLAWIDDRTTTLQKA
ncbi:hypothetical protein [Azohydromonas lata]|uniref:Uncharacterized protein n=1 Tax=Azohydromonas lata TaxID=45677 RepID=A0ABU5IDT0_9BURK|nr:hypothetical protein [Azohydromonas lata]MDZ5456123.1 hypothetical protein [Azohydromonas lata]